jgi:hypothetical protein
MPHIVTDPTLQVCPDFGSEPFGPTRDAVAAALHITPEEAADNLVASWTQQNTVLHAAWALQQEADAALQQAQEAAALLQAQADREAEDALKELEKKKPKMHTFSMTKSVWANILPHPSSYALERIKKSEYIELWYFSPEGCLDAALAQRTSADDTYGISGSDSDFMVLKLVASICASRKVLRDEDIMWDQMEIGAALLLRHMRQNSWPLTATDALSVIWYKLQNHEMHTRPNGQQILMAYQAQVRRKWHAALDLKDDRFNIVLLDDGLLAKITRELFEAD